MSAFFIDPTILSQLFEQHGCIEFAQFARIASFNSSVETPAPRAVRKRAAAAIDAAIADGSCRTERVRIWRPENNWALLWDSAVHVAPFPYEIIGEVLVRNWHKAKSGKPIDIYFKPHDWGSFRQEYCLTWRRVSARLLLVEWWWTLTMADEVSEWRCTRMGPRSERIPDLDDNPLGNSSHLRFAIYERRNNERVAVFAPAPIEGAAEHLIEDTLPRLHHDCMERGYRCQILCPKFGAALWPTFPTRRGSSLDLLPIRGLKP